LIKETSKRRIRVGKKREAKGVGTLWGLFFQGPGGWGFLPQDLTFNRIPG